MVAPSLIPSKPGDRVKTNRRDAESLAKLLRAGELTAVWVPDAKHEAMRDLVRAREAAAQDLTRKRQQVTSFLLRHGRSYPRKTTWGATHARWLGEQAFQHAEQRIAFEELVMAARQAKERVERLEAAIAEFVPKWSMAPLVEALQAMRGIGFALRFAALLFKRLPKVLELTYDVLIIIPLMIERWVIGMRAGSTGDTGNTEDKQLSKLRRAA